MIEEKTSSERYCSPIKEFHQDRVVPQDALSKRQAPKMIVDTIKFEQDGDSCDSDNMQTLTIRQEDAGEGPYWIMETGRWAFSNVDELVALLRRAEKARGGRAWRS
jgi:hypothetical protein